MFQTNNWRLGEPEEAWTFDRLDVLDVDFEDVTV